MSKANEAALSDLHGSIAIVLTAKVLEQEEEVNYDADGEAVGTGKMVYNVSPAMMSAATKFLKDNSITCDIEVNKNMTGLKDALANKQKHSRLKKPSDAAGQLHAVS